MNENPYQVLGIDPKAELESIKQVYRKEIRKYHPDTFAPRQRELERLGDRTKIHALEKEISRAKQMTQRINEAYSILSDVERRAKLDQKLSEDRQKQYQAEIMRQRSRHVDSGRRTVKSRPHRPPKKAEAENFPVLLFIGVLIALFLTAAILSNTFFRDNALENNAVVVPTRAGEVGMNDLQLTSNARQATVVARATNAVLPTSTPRSPEDNERLGDRMLELGQAHLALEAYTDSLSIAPTSVLYTKRALLYSEFFFAGEGENFALALADFDAALALDADYAPAYRGRAWLFYRRWQETTATADAEAALNDFETYLNYAKNDFEVEAAVTILREE